MVAVLVALRWVGKKTRQEKVLICSDSYSDTQKSPQDVLYEVL